MPGTPGASCVPRGISTVLARNVYPVDALFLHEGELFWTTAGPPPGKPDAGLGSIVKVSTSGGPPTVLVDSWKHHYPSGPFGAFAADGATLYFTERGDDAIFAIPTTGAAAPTMFVATPSPQGVGVVGGRVVWGDASGSLVAKGPADAAPVVLAPAHDVGSIRVTGTTIVWAGSDGLDAVDGSGGTVTHLVGALDVGDLQPDGDWVYYGDETGTNATDAKSQLSRVPRGGGPPQKLSDDHADSIAVVGDCVYFVDIGDFALRVVSVSTGERSTVLGPPTYGPFAVVSDGVALYWLQSGYDVTGNGYDSIFKLPL